jgi:hypothetical protein
MTAFIRAFSASSAARSSYALGMLLCVGCSSTSSLSEHDSAAGRYMQGSAAPGSSPSGTAGQAGLAAIMAGPAAGSIAWPADAGPRMGSAGAGRGGAMQAPVSAGNAAIAGRAAPRMAAGATGAGAGPNGGGASAGSSAAGRAGTSGTGGTNTGSMFGVDASAGWLLTVYHTPVESFHSEPAMKVTGCFAMPCENGKDDLGSYPADFVQASKDQGAGRITSGSHAGKFLNWSIDIGYWLDDGPRDARGQALVPWVSTAADPLIPYGKQFNLVDCGVDLEQGLPINPTVCAALKKGKWVVGDRFTVGSVGAQFDLYIGEEDHADFDATSPYLISAQNAQIAWTN